MVLKWQSGIDEAPLESYEVRPLKYLEYSIFYSYVVWVCKNSNQKMWYRNYFV